MADTSRRATRHRFQCFIHPSEPPKKRLRDAGSIVPEIQLAMKRRAPGCGCLGYINRGMKYYASTCESKYFINHDVLRDPVKKHYQLQFRSTPQTQDASHHQEYTFSGLGIRISRHLWLLRRVGGLTHAWLAGASTGVVNRGGFLQNQIRSLLVNEMDE